MAGACLPVAADDLTALEQDYFMDLPVALTATRLQQPLIEAPASVTVIDRQWLERSQARNLAEVLRMVPGFLVGRNNGNRPIVTYHGLGEQFVRQLQVLVDGRSIYTPTNGGAQWGSLGLSPDDIERIEIIRGPNSAAYGSNSFFAIINILTRHPAETQGQRVVTRLGSQGIRDLRIRHGGITPQTAYRLTYHHQEDDGFRGKRDQRRLDTVDARIDWTLLPGITLISHLGASQAQKGSEGVVSRINPPRTFERQMEHVHLELHDSRDTDATYRLQYYYQHSDLTDEYIALDVQDNPFATNRNSRSRRHDVELESHLRASHATRLVWGVGARLDSSESPYFFDAPGWVSNRIYRAFGNLEWSPDPRWLVNLGGMYEHNDITGDDLMPRAALVYMPDESHSFRLVASRAIRTPSLVEEKVRTADGAIASAGGLAPEVIRSLELGYQGQWADGRLVTDIKLFRNRLHDLIQVPYKVLHGIEPEGEFVNAGGMILQGVETQVAYRPGSRVWLHGGLSLLSSRSSDREARLQVESVPAHIVNLALSFAPTEPWLLTAEYYHYGSLRWNDDPTGPAIDASDGFLDLHLRRDLGGRVQAALSLTDVLARGYDTRPQGSLIKPNRRSAEAYVSLRVDF
ncbi:TonB-dependent receptor plug domain-containing protein [Ectothiorhodospira lacustris]|uniref:TonB-dependent receptor plug domain-containing protein n=1 Tax=Ectothiorhodospira lacustris TaxID=2899127 RepID=UPI001EE94B2C|nr:TonB-dependent receptor [Ectothiorhodospira lacustris]MCG5501120.1 TonB-dependent receptor [Ectothiorhodospira lacustris]